jgi:DNA topoisomerase-1
MESGMKICFDDRCADRYLYRLIVFAKDHMHLIIAEKHNVAKRISQMLAGSEPLLKRVSGVDTFQFDEKVIVGLSGHIVGVDFPQELNSWQKVDYRDLISADIITKPTHEKLISALRTLGRKADRITIATDYDREGELIGVEALRIVRDENPDISYDRVRYSAITKGEIEKAFQSPKEVDFDLAASGETRQIVDLIWGAALTRFISITSGRLGNGFLSVGRVQSPTLALIVDREKEIEAFTPKPYWEIYADLEKDLRVKHAKGRIWDKEETDRIVKNLGKVGVVESVTVGTRVDRPPAPFDTTGFISAASGIGFSATNAMRVAEWLYINGFISYPRTDNTVYPKSLDLKSLVSMFLNSNFKEEASALLRGNLSPSRGKRASTDHPPIYPTSVAKKGDLKEDQWKIYELVVRRFFATLSDKCTWETVGVNVDINGESFKASGARLVEPGWRAYYPYSKAEEHILPELFEGCKLAVLGHEVSEKETQPPARYGHGRLVKLMDELGLGTKSTRHDIIGKLYARAYVHGNPIRPTNAAYAVIDALERYAPTITKPEMTQTLERDMNQITEGKIQESEVIDESRVMLHSVFDELLENQSEIETSLREGLRSDRIVGTCKSCGSDLIIRRGRRGGRFIGCTGYPSCTFTLPLPRMGMIVVTDKECAAHGMYHIRIINKGKRPWNLGCPHCNFIEWEAKKALDDEEKKKKGSKNDLPSIAGIGPKTLEKLEAAGVKTAGDLAASEAEDLTRKTGISQKKILTWQKIARSLIESSQ